MVEVVEMPRLVTHLWPMIGCIDICTAEFRAEVCLICVGLFETPYRQHLGEPSRLIQRRKYGIAENCF